MWRGCFSSCKYSPICLSESWRPNQVFHQNKNGMRTISHPVAKNSSRLRVDMRGRDLETGTSSLGADWISELGEADMRATENIAESEFYSITSASSTRSCSR